LEYEHLLLNYSEFVNAAKIYNTTKSLLDYGRFVAAGLNNKSNKHASITTEK